MNNDRRRINGPPGDTSPPVYASYLSGKTSTKRPARTRAPDELRKIFLNTSLSPSASGSAYLELLPSAATTHPSQSLIPAASTPKLTCTIHGPRPLPRSAPFTPHLLLTTHVKFAPFASRHPRRRGYVRDQSERDLSAHLEAALRGVIIGERWPKSGVEVVVTVLEGEEDGWWGDELGVGQEQADQSISAGAGGWGMMTVLAGCITVASAALAEAGIDCVDLVTGGVAALVRNPASTSMPTAQNQAQVTQLVLDPCPSEHAHILAACVVGYLPSRDELTEVWMKGDIGMYAEALVDHAVDAASTARGVLYDVVMETAQAKYENGQGVNNGAKIDVAMSG